MEDLRKNIISDWTAKNIYRILYDSVRRRVDADATREVRAAERKARISRGLPFAKFEEMWRKQKPPDAALVHYGTWPDAKPTGPVYRP